MMRPMFGTTCSIAAIGAAALAGSGVAATSQSAPPELVKLSENEDLTQYVDRSSIRFHRDGQTTFTVVGNLKKLEPGIPTKGSISYWSIDCKTRMLRGVGMKLVTGTFGRGEVTFTDQNLRTGPFHASGKWQAHGDLACGKLSADDTPPFVEASIPSVPPKTAPAQDVDCLRTQYVNKELRDPRSGQMRELVDRQARNLLSPGLQAIAAKSFRGRKLPGWFKPGEWLEGEPSGGYGSQCVVWEGSEWLVRHFFRAHQAPDGYGFIFIDLTNRVAYLTLGRDVEKGPILTHLVGPDASVLATLGRGWKEVEYRQFPVSCQFTPGAAKCK